MILPRFFKTRGEQVGRGGGRGSNSFDEVPRFWSILVDFLRGFSEIFPRFFFFFFDKDGGERGESNF